MNEHAATQTTILFPALLIESVLGGLVMIAAINASIGAAIIAACGQVFVAFMMWYLTRDRRNGKDGKDK
jgi:prolipoprotein diacylglyceryltransferase